MEYEVSGDSAVTEREFWDRVEKLVDGGVDNYEGARARVAEQLGVRLRDFTGSGEEV